MTSVAVTTEEVTFPAGDLTLAGDLRVPETSVAAPALVFTGPLSGVKDQVTGHYARRLAEAGFVTLAFDHRNFGASEGTPRQHEEPAGKLVDLAAATTYLAARPEVDAGRIGACGICLGGGYALRFAAFDPRIAAVVGIAGGYNDPRAMRRSFGGTKPYRAQLARSAEVAARQLRTGEVEYLAAVADDDTPAVMGGQEPFDYYGTERSSSATWVNRLTALTLRELITVDLAIGADFIDPTPFLVVHGRNDAYCSPEGAQDVFDRAGPRAEIAWLPTVNHIDLYDNPDHVEPAAAHAGAWFARHL